MGLFKFDEEFLFGTATSSAQIEGGDTNHTWFRWCEKNRISDGSSCYRACDHWNRMGQDTEILEGLQVRTHRMSLEYVNFAVERLGDLVCEWVTFNEPNVYTVFGYLLGIFPPGVRNIIKGFKVAREIVKTHISAYRSIHKIRKERQFKGETMVGAAMHLRIFDGITIWGKLTASVVDYIFHTFFMEGLVRGKFRFRFGKKSKKESDRFMDFLGINYYTRNIVEFVFSPSNYFYKFLNDKNLYKSDLGWDIYPEGIYTVSKKYYEKYKLPIYITENGICDRYDNRRPDFILDHLENLHRAVREGIIIKRYYHWTLMDNFEWNEGEWARFGLYHCNFDTQTRTPRRSAELYREICAFNGITEEMAEKFSAKRL